MAKMRAVLEDLIHRRLLSPSRHDHRLTGEWKDCRECHLEPDWLLVYMIADDELVLIGTGTHADLFR